MKDSSLYEDGEGRARKKKPSKADIVKRMVASYRKRKREEKISKLQSDSSHWSGLE